MLYVLVYTHERRTYPTTLYLTSFTLDSLLALSILAQRKTHGWGVSPWTLWLAGLFRVTVRFGTRGEEGLLDNRPTGGYSNHDNFNEQKSHGHEEL